jgi:hypothetical protein
MGLLFALINSTILFVRAKGIMIDVDIKKQKQKELAACQKTYLVNYLQQLMTTFGQPPPDTSRVVIRYSSVSQTFLVTEHFLSIYGTHIFCGPSYLT